MKKIVYEKDTQIGYWTVKDENYINGKRYYHCICQCGKEKDILPYLLNGGKTMSCGCMAKLGKGADLTGEVRGNLTIENKIIIGNRTFYKVRCVCGNEKLVATNQINLITSCGCRTGTGEKIRDSLKPYLKNGTYLPGLTRKTVNKNNTSGYKGVSYRKDRNKYRAYIKYQRKNIFLGYYDKLEDAVEARKIAEKIVLEEVLSD